MSYREDDLQCRGYKIYQDPDGYCFTSDSVLLANLAKVKRTDRVVDLCTGSGVIALLIAAKYEPKEVIGVELQISLAEMAAESVKLNRAEDVVKIKNADINGIHKEIGSGFDVVTVNPPYEPVYEKKESYTEEEICKSEVKTDVKTVIEESAKLLRFGGLFYMINRSRRLADVIYYMRENGIEPKKLYLIQPKKDKVVDAFVVEGKRGGKPALDVPAPIIVYDDNGEYTSEVRGLYNK